MRLAVVVPFLDEEEHLPALLESLATQTQRPDQLLLVDDGSTDRSAQLVQAFCEGPGRGYARLLRRPARPVSADRLGQAAELQAFLWAVGRLDDGWEVVGKLDADLRLTPATFARVCRALQADPTLGLTGPFLSIRDGAGQLRRERCPPHHVRGATKFYRRACFEQIAPLAPILGWDTIDEVSARLHGWRTASLSLPEGDPEHLRPTGAVDGRLRAYRRWGACAYAIGDHPLWLALGTLRRARERPWGLSGAAYLAGWGAARARRAPRAPVPVRAHVRREQLGRMRAALAPSRRGEPQLLPWPEGGAPQARESSAGAEPLTHQWQGPSVSGAAERRERTPNPREQSS